MIKKFNKYLSYRNNSLYLDETSFESIKKKYSTPLYCYSLSEIYDNFVELKKSFTKIKPMICYAVKANNHNQILSLLSKSGCGADVVSKGELKKSIDNGVTPDKIVFSGVGKTKDEIKYALNKKIKQLNVESEEELEEIAEIAKMTANVATTFGFSPVMALLSYANFGSSTHPRATKVKEAVKILHANNPELVVDGEIQIDFALNKELHQGKFPFSKLSGKKVNTLIFPNLDSANTNYKVIKELDNAMSIGPIMMGMSKAVHVLQLGASVEEMVNMSAVAVVDAQKKAKLKK